MGSVHAHAPQRASSPALPSPCGRRKRLSLTADKALFIFIASTLPPTSMLMREVYALHADAADGFLYVKYSGESTFGGAR